MTLTEFARDVANTIEAAREYDVSPDDIQVSLQIEGAGDGSVLGNGTVCAWEEVELIYDNDGQASGCVLVGYPGQEELGQTPGKEKK